MLWHHSESFLLLLWAILTNHKSLLQESKCTFSNTMDTIVDIKIALTKGLKSLEPFRTDSLEECHNECCTGRPLIGENLCNFMTFNRRNNSSFQNCYLFYCPNKDACPLMSSEGYVSQFIQRDLASMKELDESMKERFPDRVGQSSDHRVSTDLLNNPTSNLASTQIVTTLQKMTMQPVSYSTYPKVSIFPVTTKQLTMTRTPKVSMVAMLLRTTYMWTTDKSKTSTVLPTTQSTTVPAFLASLPLTSTQLTRTNHQTRLLMNKIQPVAATTLPQILPITTTQTTTTLLVTNTQATTLSATIAPSLPVTTIWTTTLPTTLPITTTQTTTTLPVTTTPTTTTKLLTTTILPKNLLTTRKVSIAKLIIKKTEQSPISRVPAAKTPFFEIITGVVNNGGNSMLDQKPLERQDKLGGQMDDSKMKIQSGLIAALFFGLLFLIVAMVLLSKQISESYSRRHYTRIDYLINGMYIAA
ncbi:MANSC domain-containing protein 1-like [Hemiscyllium ocellatum]|uniref:MANSC domain-containing protein 1-like n=1 Tax=Hemiscyllium ocellatum TaxID=170820 RepID=UPI0029677827|nr:MANSC domain-containing protein 1-like [Hemiscyllium ocellatum]XP_060695822.1 MANSC domain-containing protein 1-like [Hemiscyllium ocellatum]